MFFSVILLFVIRTPNYSFVRPFSHSYVHSVIARPCLLRPWQSRLYTTSVIAKDFIFPIYSHFWPFSCHCERSEAISFTPHQSSYVHPVIANEVKQSRLYPNCHCEAVSSTAVAIAFTLIVIARPCLLRPWQSPFFTFRHCEAVSFSFTAVAIAFHTLRSHCEAVSFSFTAVAIAFVVLPFYCHSERSGVAWQSPLPF